MDPVAARVRQMLLGAANPGGGWGYTAGKSSRVEPTAWALLALHESAEEDAASQATFVEPHLAWLAATQRSGGLLAEHPGQPPNLTANGIAACALRTVDASRRRADVLSRLIDGIVALKGIAVDNPDPKQDNSLQGWPWIPDTFSWVEPTAICTLALKAMRQPTAAMKARIDEAERLLLNRSCDGGGWNFGNASTLSQDLRPYVPTTALALLALQDRRTQAEVTSGMEYLTRSRVSEPSAMALSLALMAFTVYAQPVDEVRARLAEIAGRSEELGLVHTLAMMLFALTTADHQVRAFRVMA